MSQSREITSGEFTEKEVMVLVECFHIAQTPRIRRIEGGGVTWIVNDDELSDLDCKLDKLKRKIYEENGLEVPILD